MPSLLISQSSLDGLQDLYNEVVDVEVSLKKLGKKMRQLCQQNETCRHILKVPGVGELTATDIVAVIPMPTSSTMVAICRHG